MSRSMLSVISAAVVLPALLAASPVGPGGSSGPESKLAVKLPKPPARVPGAAARAQTCLECHDQMMDLFKGDKHVAHDFHCAVCHGESKAHLEMQQEGTLPDRTWRRWIEEENRFEWRMKNASLEIAKFCASCHGNKPVEGQNIKTINWKEYLNSGHGSAMYQGDHDAPTCTDCHYAHGAGSEPLTDKTIVQRCALCHADQQMMRRAGLDPDVIQDFKADAHENMDSASAEQKSSCISCHYPH